MKKMTQIEVKKITKTYALKGRRSRKTALSDITFSVSKGETVGIIGKNGSGKSTLLKLLCGITAPDSGEIRTDGRIAALLELGAGFLPEYNGTENIYLNGAFNGFTKKEIKEKLPDILEFADIGDFINQPVKTYSDGMLVRLAFAAAIFNNPDILIIDEALAVGDIMFRAKCFNKIEELKNNGVTVIYVTHDIDSVRRICSRAVWIDSGRLIADGDVCSVTSRYIESSLCTYTDNNKCGMINRFGTHTGSVKEVVCREIWQTGQRVNVRITADIPHGADREGMAVSLSVKNPEGLDIIVLCTDKIVNRDSITAEFSFINPLCGGSYFLAAALENRNTMPISYYDYCEGIVKIQCIDSENNFGLVHIASEVTVNDRKKL